MADDVVIGSASVQITGDYSGLEKSFTESQQLAQSAGQQIGAALESGAAGANALTESATIADDKLQSLFASGMTLSEAMAALGTESAAAAQSVASVGEGSKQSASGLDDLGDAFKRVRNDAEAFEKAWGEALVEDKKRTDELAASTDKLADSIGAIVAGLGLKQLGEDSILAYGKVQQLTTSLDLLGAGAKGAAAELEVLKTLSIQMAVPFEDLASKAQSLAAQFGTGEGLTAVLIAAGNAAAATGKSFDAAAGSIERIAVTGAVSARQLFALGLSWQDMANTMGVSIEEAHDKLKKGGQSALQDVSDVIDAINTKFGDAAERQAQNTLGVWTNLKNQAEFTFQEIGQNLDGILDVFTGAMKVIASGLVAVIGGTQLVTIEVIGMVREAIEAIKGLGSVALAAMKGDLAGAAIAAAAAYNNIKTTSEYTNQSLEDHAKKTAQSLLNIWMDSSKKISATFTPTGGGTGDDGKTKAIAEKIRGYRDLTESLAVWLAMEKQEIAQQQDVVNSAAKYNEITKLSLTAVQYLQLQVAKANGDFATFDALTKNASGNLYVMADAAKMAAVNVSVFDRSGQENQLAINAAEAKTAFDALAPSIDKSDKLLKTMGKDAADTQKQLLSLSPEGKLGSALENIGIKWDKVTESTDRAKQASAEYVAANSADFNKTAIAWEVLNSSVNRLARVNLPEAINVQNELIASMERMNAPMLQIIQAQEKELQLEIELRTERGQSANLQIIALANMRAGTAALSVLNNSLANTYVALGHTITGAIAPLSSAIAQIINGAGSFYKAWHQAMNQFEAQLLGTVIQAIVEYGVAWVKVHILHMAQQAVQTSADIAGITTVSAARTAATTLQLAQITTVAAAQSAAIATVTAEQLASFVTIKAASTALDVADVLGYAAVGGAAAAASTAAIPIIGPALALEAGAAMYAGIAGIYGPLATFSEGGMVPEDMIAMVHKGEYVLNAEKTASAIVGGPTKGGGEIHVHFDFGGAHFSNGLNDTQVKTVFDRAFRMSKLAGALPAGRFPQ